MAPVPKPDFDALLDRYLDDIDEFEDWRSNTDIPMEPVSPLELWKVA